MRQPEYIEGPQATESFERGMKALFSVPKDEVVKVEKKRKGKASPRPRSVPPQEISDKDWKGTCCASPAED